MGEGSQRPFGRRPIIGISVVAAACAIVATITLLRFWPRTLEADLINRVLQDAFARATGGQYALRADSLSIDAEAQVFVLYGGVLTGTDSLSTQAQPRFSGHFESARLSGISLWDIARGRLATRGAVAIERPVVHIALAPEDTSRAPTSAAHVLEDLADRLHGLRLDSVALRDMTVSLTLIEHDWTDTLNGIDVHLFGVDVDSTQSPFVGSFPFVSDMTVRVAPHIRYDADSLYALTVGELTASAAQRRIRLDTLSYRPTMPDLQLLRRIGHRAGRYDLTLGPIEAKAVDVRGLIEHRRIAAINVEIDRALLVYFNDLRWPSGPTRDKILPHEWIQHLGSVVAIDTLRIRDGRIDFSRFAEDGARPARLAFTGFRLTGTHLTNDPAAMDPEHPATLFARAHLAGAGLLTAHFSMDLLSPTFDMRVDGRLGPMSLLPLNRMLLPSEGLEIRSGNLHDLAFRMRIRNGAATGYLSASYEDLRVNEVNKVSGRMNIRRRIRSFLLNRLVLKSDNMPREGQPAREGVVEHRYDRRQTFLRFLWLSVRSGIFSITGLEPRAGS